MRHFIKLQIFLFITLSSLFAFAQEREIIDVNDVRMVKVLQKEIMAKLTGAAEISPGVTIPNRNTPENRVIARQYIFDLLKEFGFEPVRHPYRENGENIYAILDATEKSGEYIVLGAHFDSVRDCPGANDNASGSVMVLTIAKMMKQMKERSKNMIFILFDEEERGMRGSRAFAQKLKDENFNITSVHTIDQMCWDEDGDRAIELEIPYEGAEELYDEAKKAAGFTFTIHTTKEAGSDHSAFRRLGFNAVGLTEEYRNGDTTPHIHRSTDSFDTVNFEFLLSSTLLTYEAMKILVKESPIITLPGYSSLQAQTGAVTPDDYGKWERLGSGTLSQDGQWLAYSISRVNKENELRIRKVETREITIIPYGSRPVFSDDGAWLAYSIGLSEEEREKLVKQKKPVRNKLGFLRLATGEQTEIDEVASFSFNDDGTFLAMRRYPVKDKKSKGVDIVVRNLSSGSDMNFGNVSEFAWQPKGKLLAMVIDAEGKAGNGVNIYNPETGALRILDSEPEKYGGMVWREDEDDLAVFREFSDEAYEGEGNVILVWHNLSKTARKSIFDPSTEMGFPADSRIVNFRRLQWSDNGEYVYFGIKEWDKKMEDSGSLEEAPGLQIWHSKDVHIIPEQVARADRNRVDSYLAVWHIKNNSFIQIEDDLTESSRIQTDIDVALGLDGTPYEIDMMFGRPNSDLYKIDIRTGEKQKILSKVNNIYSISPDGKNVAYLKDDHYYVYNFKSEEHKNLTADVPALFINKDYDHPVEQKPPYRFVDWAKDGKSFFVNSKYDIWQLWADGSRSRKISDGKADRVIHRLVRLDREENYIDAKKPMILSLQGEWSKKYGYARVIPGKNVERLVWEEAYISGLNKAKKAEVYVYMAQDFDDSPDYFAADGNFAQSKQITETNPFQKDYAWGKSELIEYMNANGRKLQGALFYPAGYQPGEKYPMITYIYEMRSQMVRRYVVPSHLDYYNINVFTSKGYFVLQPDIVFDPGNPGISSVSTMEAAVKIVVDMGLVDENRVGLVGHSWGGYQAAFAPTHTDIFAASVAGAGLTDFFSMYGMVMWSAGGLPETNHFEVGQERMIVPPWKDIDGFVRNSPVLHVENLNTPLLFEVGDNDRNVDWRQGIELYNTARRAGKQMVLLVYADEGHGLRQDKNRIDYHRRILQWFGHYLNGEPAEKWIETGVPYTEQLKDLKNWKK